MWVFSWRTKNNERIIALMNEHRHKCIHVEIRNVQSYFRVILAPFTILAWSDTEIHEEIGRKSNKWKIIIIGALYILHNNTQ